MAEYNGFPNWNQWNVSLWVNNDEGLYRLAVECFKAKQGNKAKAAQSFLKQIAPTRFTPDGARYSKVAVIGAMEGYEL